MVQHQLVRALHDQGIQEHVLAHAATEEGAKIDLVTTVDLVEAKLNSESLHKSSNVNRLSDYKKGVNNDQVEQSAGRNEGTCRWCKRKDTEITQLK